MLPLPAISVGVIDYTTTVIPGNRTKNTRHKKSWSTRESSRERRAGISAAAKGSMAHIRNQEEDHGHQSC